MGQKLLCVSVSLLRLLLMANRIVFGPSEHLTFFFCMVCEPRGFEISGWFTYGEFACTVVTSSFATYKRATDTPSHFPYIHGTRSIGNSILKSGVIQIAN